MRRAGAKAMWSLAGSGDIFERMFLAFRLSQPLRRFVWPRVRGVCTLNMVAAIVSCVAPPAPDFTKPIEVSLYHASHLGSTDREPDSLFLRVKNQVNCEWNSQASVHSRPLGRRIRFSSLRANTARSTPMDPLRTTAAKAFGLKNSISISKQRKCMQSTRKRRWMGPSHAELSTVLPL